MQEKNRNCELVNIQSEMCFFIAVCENCCVGLFASQLMQCNRVSPADVRTVKLCSLWGSEQRERMKTSERTVGELATPRPAAMERWAENGGGKPIGERGMMQAPGKHRDSLSWGSHQPTSQESPHTPRDFSGNEIQLLQSLM